MRKLFAEEGRIAVEVVPVETNKMPIKRQLNTYAVIALILLSSAPAMADESGQGLFSGLFSAISSLFHSPIEPSRSDQAESASQPVRPAQVTQADNSEKTSDLSITELASLQSSRATSQQSQSDSAFNSQATTAPAPVAPALPVTQDSLVKFSGTIPSDAHWLMTMIRKDGDKNLVQDLTPVVGGAPIPTLYLHQGAGKYDIWLYASKSADKTKNTYEYFATQTIKNEDSRENAFLLPSLNIQSDDPEIIALSAQITNGLTTDREKAMEIHDWLTRVMTYDIEGIRSNSFLTRPQDAKAVARSRLAVCDGFSNLFAALSRAAGVPAKVVTGPLGVPSSNLTKEQMCDPKRRDALLHAWNEVYIDNRWVTLDATLDAGSDHTELRSDGDRTYFKRTPNNHALFDPAPSFFEHDHTKCDEAIR